MFMGVFYTSLKQTKIGAVADLIVAFAFANLNSKLGTFIYKIHLMLESRSCRSLTLQVFPFFTLDQTAIYNQSI